MYTLDSHMRAKDPICARSLTSQHPLSELKLRTSELKPKISKLKPRTSELKPRISELKPN